MRKGKIIVQYSILGLSLIGFAAWILTTSTPLTGASALAGGVCCALFAIAAYYSVDGLFAFFSGMPETDPAAGLGRRSLHPNKRHPWLRMIVLLLALRLLVLLLAYVLDLSLNGYSGGLINKLNIWLRGDAPHYLGIADNWYVTEGDPRFHIVFFPLYPIVVRLASGLFSQTLYAGLFVNIICAALSGYALYELALLDMDRSAAKRVLRYLYLLPAAFLLNAPMSDALFLLLSILCMYLARKKHFAAACILAGLAAFTRVLGVLLALPVMMEMAAVTVREYKLLAGGRDRALLWRQLRRYAPLLLIALGLLLYLYINYAVTGNAFQFLTYQREHWSQRMGIFWNTAAYQTDAFLTALGSDNRMALGLWLPNLLYLFGGMALLLIAYYKANKRGEALGIRASYVAYFLVYYGVSMGATWLLSAPRYLSCAFPLAFILERCITSARARTAAVIVLLLLQILYLAMYTAGYPVY